MTTSAIRSAPVVACSACDGAGHFHASDDPYGPAFPCEACFGTGEVLNTSSAVLCPFCDGEVDGSRAPAAYCSRCDEVLELPTSKL